MEIKKQDKNILAVGIGVGLIFLVALVTLWKPLSQEESEVAPESSTPVDDSVQKEKQIDAAELIKKILSDENVVIIDTRTETDFRKEHITHSRNIPAADLKGSVPLLDKAKKYAIVGYEMNQGDADALDALFKANGIADPQYLPGGLEDWKANYGPTISDGDPNSFTDQSKVSYVKSDKLKELLAGNESLFIIDLRKKGQYDEGHIKNAVNIFLDDLEAEEKQIPAGRKIILYDNDGLWAFKGAVRLYDLGFFNVTTLSDGLNAWKQKGFEIVK